MRHNRLIVIRIKISGVLFFTRFIHLERQVKLLLLNYITGDSIFL